MQSLGSHRRSSFMRASAKSLGRAAISADVAQSVELRFCKPEVRGSSPLVSSKSTEQYVFGGYIGKFVDFAHNKVLPMVGCPSGQWERAVNPPAYAYGGSNPPPTTNPSSLASSVEKYMTLIGWQADSDSAIGRAPHRGSSSVGRASAFQAERRGFESLLPLRSITNDAHVKQYDRRSACAHLAQMVERVLGKDEVTSSILVVGSKRQLTKTQVSVTPQSRFGR